MHKDSGFEERVGRVGGECFGDRNSEARDPDSGKGGGVSVRETAHVCSTLHFGVLLSFFFSLSLIRLCFVSRTHTYLMILFSANEYVCKEQD